MNRKGFTLIELLAVIVILALVLGVGYAVSGNIFNETKDKTEKVFINTLEDAMDMFLDSDSVKNLNFNKFACSYNRNNQDFTIYSSDTSFTFNHVINSEYHPINADDLVNPANKEKCDPSSIRVTIYRDNNYVYYYKVDNINCLSNNTSISNLPEECNG